METKYISLFLPQEEIIYKISKGFLTVQSLVKFLKLED